MELPAELVSLDPVPGCHELSDMFKKNDLDRSKRRMELEKKRQSILDHIKESSLLPTLRTMEKYDISWQQIARLFATSIRNRDPDVPVIKKKRVKQTYVKKKDRDPEKEYKNYSKYIKKEKIPRPATILEEA